MLQSQYRVMRLLSDKTGFGTVYEAYQQDVPKILKVLKPNRSDDSKVVQLFQKEAKVLSQIKHSGVPFVAADGYFTYLPRDSSVPLHCIVMEKIDGPNLQQWMQQQGNHPIGEHQAIQWLTQLTDILRRVHQHNYFHRDIKPDNIMLRANGQLVLVDFGAAREMTQTYLAQVGSLGVTTVSSAGYTPPEQEQGQAVPQSDFYALGRTIIYLLTGRSPNDTALYDPMLNVFNWRPKTPQISADFADLLDSLVSPRVIDRPKTAQAILERLHQLSPQSWQAREDIQNRTAETALPAHKPPNLFGANKTAADQAATTTQVPSTSTAAPVTIWTWLIGGGVTLLAVGLVGLGLWGRQRQPNAIANQTELQAPEPGPTAPDADAGSPSAPEGPVQVALLRTFTAHQSSVNMLKLLSDGQQFMSASADKTLHLWDLSTGEIRQIYQGHTAFVNTITFSPDEQTVYSGSADGAIHQWNLATGVKEAQFSGHIGAINTLDRTPDGLRLVSGAADGTIKIWNSANQAVVSTLEGHIGAVNALLIADDGQRIISGGADKTIRVWDMALGETRQVLEGHDSYINAIAISSDGRSLFSASADRTIKRWDLNTGEVLATLTGHPSYINALTVSRDGQTMSSGSADGTVKVWDIKTDELLVTYTGFNMPVDELLMPSAKLLVTASEENRAIKAWSIDP